MAHTDLPWRADGAFIEDETSYAVADCDFIGSANADENAAFIVLAANNHDTLLAALRLAHARFALLWPDRQPSDDAAWQAVHDAIGRATGNE